jgi:hypothetical protein
MKLNYSGGNIEPFFISISIIIIIEMEKKFLKFFKIHFIEYLKKFKIHFIEYETRAMDT